MSRESRVKSAAGWGTATRLTIALGMVAAACLIGVTAFERRGAAAEELAPMTSDGAESLVVVELFTSQGCSTCPPADRLLGELIKHDHVIGLTLNVDYWNRLGWPDRFSKPQFTERQRRYQQSFGSYTVYTPQMVVQGADGLVGSNASAVVDAIAAHAARPLPVTVTLSTEGDALRVTLSTAAALEEPATVWLLGYDGPHVESIGAGENRGETLTYHNVTRDMRAIAMWDGAETWSGLAPIDRGLNGYVVMVQDGRLGPVLGVARIVLNPPHDEAALND